MKQTLQSKMTISEEEIKEKLMQHYGNTVDRELVKTEVVNDHGTVGSVYYSLDGSPPKGHAIYIPGISQLSLYDSHGKRFRIIRGVHDVE